MSILELIKSRRSIRKYTSSKVSGNDIDKLVEAGRWAPSSGNRQPWKFIIVSQEETLQALSLVLKTGRFIGEAPLAIAVVVNPAVSRRYLEDGGAAIQNIMLEAHALGYGSCWIGCYDSPQEEPAKHILGIPDNEILQAIVTVGHPVEIPEKTRKGIEETVFHESYSKK
ncbi:nitroreductase family protein [Chloroflexota bacterium]